MPDQFFDYQAEYNPAVQSDPAIEAQFSMLDLARYDTFRSDNMTTGYTSIEDAPDPPQWNTSILDRYLEVTWELEDFVYNFQLNAITFRDTELGDFFGLPLRTVKEYLTIYYQDESLGTHLWEDVVELTFGELENVTLSMRGTYISADVILSGNGLNLSDAWNNNSIGYLINYGIDFSAMKPDAWSLIAQLLTFQDPDFGLPEELEAITYPISLAIWIVVAIIAYTIITKLLPTIQGGVED